jgi:hypothetical protein
MAKAEINAGACGFITTVETTMEGKMTCNVHIESECAAMQRLAGVLTQVQPFDEISFRKKMPTILELGTKYCTHPACPVPVGVIKAVEVAAHLALPKDATIHLSD